MKAANFTVVLLLIAAAAAIYFFVPFGSNLSIGGGSGSPAPTAPETAVSYRVLLDGQESNINDRVNYVIRNNDDLLKLWNLIDTANDVPTIDFSQEEVFAVFAGQEPTAGYSIAVSGVGDTATSREVHVTIVKPGSSCSNPQQITTPFEIIAVASTSLPLTHDDTVKTLDCTSQ